MFVIPLRATWILAAFVAAALACTPAFAAKKSKIADDDDMSGLLEMSDQLDRVDSQDFQAAIDRANDCTRARDFSCSERELAKAAKLANGAQDRNTLLAARQKVISEKTQIAEEKRRREEELRREAERQLAEERVREREQQAMRDADEADERQSARDSNAENYATIMDGFNSNLETLANINRQTNERVKEINRVQAERAAAQERIRVERMEHEAEQRRERRMEDARQSRERLAQADTRNREYGSSNAYGGGRPSPSASGAANRGNTSAPVAAKSKLQSRKSSFLPAASEPNPYGDSNGHGVNGWVSLSAGRGQTREAACSEATNNGKAEIARLSTLFHNDAISPCVCSVNTGLGGGFWESMAEANEPNQWACRVYEKRTKIRDPGNVSR